MHLGLRLTLTTTNYQLCPVYVKIKQFLQDYKNIAFYELGKENNNPHLHIIINDDIKTSTLRSRLTTAKFTKLCLKQYKDDKKGYSCATRS